MDRSMKLPNIADDWGWGNLLEKFSVVTLCLKRSESNSQFNLRQYPTNCSVITSANNLSYLSELERPAKKLWKKSIFFKGLDLGSVVNLLLHSFIIRFDTIRVDTSTSTPLVSTALFVDCSNSFCGSWGLPNDWRFQKASGLQRKRFLISVFSIERFTFWSNEDDH